MPDDHPRRLFLRSLLPRVRLTGVRSECLAREAGTVLLGQRLCWAAGLAELEQVEIANLTRGGRLVAHVGFGPEREVVVAGPGTGEMSPGDSLRISAYAWVPTGAIDRHAAIMAQVDASNALIEFRRMSPRLLRVDPTFRAPPPAIDVIVELPPLRQST